MKDNLSHRCDYEGECPALLPILELMSRLKGKRSSIIDYVDLRKGYEVLLKHFCNDVLSCQDCLLYQDFLEQEVEAEMPSRTCGTSDENKITTTTIFDKEKITTNTWSK